MWTGFLGRIGWAVCNKRGQNTPKGMDTGRIDVWIETAEHQGSEYALACSFCRGVVYTDIKDYEISCSCGAKYQIVLQAILVSPPNNIKE